jgi:capsule polysaccharide export protein KpsE/RkpR
MRSAANMNQDLTPAGQMPLPEDDDGPRVSLVDLLTWLGEGKRVIAWITGAAAAAALAGSFLVTPIFTARTTLLPPGSQQQGSSAAALAALGALGGLAGGLAAKTPDELYVALLKSESLLRELDKRFDLRARYGVQTFEALRKTMPTIVRVAADKKSGLISLDVDDEDPKFAAELANAYVQEVTKLLGRLAVSEAQLRRVFFEQQLKETKDNLVKAEQDMQRVQEKSGVIVLDKQAEALIGGAAQIRAQIAEREVQLRVLRNSATEQNPDVQRLISEIRALRSELARMESTQGGAPGSAVDLPVGRIPEAAIEYIRARRELKLQETILESMLRQYEVAKLDEAKEGPVLQQVDVAQPPDYKSKPSRAMIVLAGTFLALLASSAWVIVRGFARATASTDPSHSAAWQAMRQAWRIRR